MYTLTFNNVLQIAPVYYSTLFLIWKLPHRLITLCLINLTISSTDSLLYMYKWNDRTTSILAKKKVVCQGQSVVNYFDLDLIVVSLQQILCHSFNLDEWGRWQINTLSFILNYYIIIIKLGQSCRRIHVKYFKFALSQLFLKRGRDRDEIFKYETF